MVTEKKFETAPSVSSPWFIAGMNFEPSQRKLRIRVDFEVGSRFALPGQSGEPSVHDTVTKSYRHLDFFEHECELEVRVPRMKLPDGSVRQVNPPRASKLHGFTLLFEAFVLLLCRKMLFSGVARITEVSVHRVMALAERYVNAAVGEADLSQMRRLAIDETSRAKGHDHVTLVADSQARNVIYVAKGNEAATVEAFAGNLRARHDQQPHGAHLAVQGPATRNSYLQAAHCRAHAAVAMVHERAALDGGALERGCRDDLQALRRYTHLERLAADQRVPGDHQRPIPGCQTQGARIRPLPDRPHRHLPHRRQAGLLQAQPLCRTIHMLFNRAT